MKKYTLEILPYHLAILQLSPKKEIPKFIFESEFYTISKSRAELSIVAQSKLLSQIESDLPIWRAFRFAGVLDFGITGILAEISQILAQEYISIFAISTFDTDYILVKDESFTKAHNVLKRHYDINLLWVYPIFSQEVLTWSKPKLHSKMNKAKLLNQFSQLLDEIELKEKTSESFYEFETKSVELLTELNRNVMEQAIGEAGEDYRKKKA